MLTTKMIGNRIAEARKKINISQSQLAQRLFISSQAVGKWERGESMPDIITLNRLSEILGVDLNYFSERFRSLPSEEAAENISRSDPKDEKPLSKQPDILVEKKLSWDMSRGNWADADFSGLKNLHEKFNSSNMLRCKFIGSDLSGLLLKGNNVEKCDFSASDFSTSRIQGSNLSDNKFRECSLKETEFSGSHIKGCDLTASDLSGFVMKSGGFEKNTIINAYWNHTSFIETYLADLVFNGLINDCYFENCAFKRVTFKDATFTGTFFKNKSLKGIRFINCQSDRMTYEFLKNGKADLTGITLLLAQVESE
jgi:uncharacterized protein YjbI with pentapeptide repeats